MFPDGERVILTTSNYNFSLWNKVWIPGTIYACICIRFLKPDVRPMDMIKFPGSVAYIRPQHRARNKSSSIERVILYY